MPQPIIPEDAYIQSPTQSVDNNSAPKIVIPEDAYMDRNSKNIGNKITANQDHWASMGRAALKGTNQGLDDILSTVAKGISKIAPYVGLPKLSTADVQSYYEKNLDTYNKDADTNAHSFASGVGRVAGNVAATAPLSLLTGGGTAAGSAAAQMGLKAAGQGVARAAGEMGVNALQGGLMGGMSNQAGNQNVFNAPGMRMGSAIGATAGAVMPAMASNYAKNLDNYSQFSDDLSKVGYKGPVFSTDVPGNQGIYNSIKESVTNGVLSKLPIVRNMPLVGTEAARNAQQSGMESVLKDMANKYTSIDKTMSLNQFRNALLKAKSSADETVSMASSEFRNILNQNGINTHSLTDSLPVAQDLLQNDFKVLSNQARDALQSMQSSMSTSTILGSKEAVGLKQRIWKEYERLAGDRTDTAAYNAANKLNDLYHNFNSDMLSSVSNVPQAAEAFNRFNTVTSGIKTLWDPKNSRALATAMKDINGDASGMVNFFNKLKNNSLSPQAYNKYSNMVGKEGMGAVQDQALGNMFKANLSEDGRMNVSKLLDTINNAPAGAVNSEIVDSLKGLSYLASKTAKGLKPSSGNGSLETAAGAALGGAAYMSPAIQGLVATGAAMGAITAHAPIKNFLIGINKTIGVNEPLSQYLINKASKYMNRAGILMILNQQDGNIDIHKQDLGDK